MSSTHFVRPAVTAIWKQLNELEISTSEAGACLNVSGPPGTGKSSTLFAWVVYMGMLCGDLSNNVMWVHALEDQVNVLRIVNRKADTTTCTLSAVSKLSECFDEYDVICLDGFRKEMAALMLGAMRKKRKVVTCTSYQSSAMSSEAADFVVHQSKDLTVYNWTLDEYRLCLENNLPGEAFKDEASLLLQHYYAGGSMRLMQWEIDSLRKYLDKKIAEVNDKKVLLQGMQGVSGSMAVNTLIAEYDGDADTVLLSRYVARKVAWSVDDIFIAEAGKRLPQNPSWQGWVFEMKVINLVHRDNKLALRYIGASSAKTAHLSSELQLTGSTVCAPESFLDLPARVPEGNMWLLPEKWNQACFDLVFYTELKLWFVQVTVGKSHTYKLDALIPVMQKLHHNAASSTILVVTSSQNFKVTPSNLVKPAVGELSTWSKDNVEIAELSVRSA